MNPILANWRTTALGLVPLAPYILQTFGIWPSQIPLPPFEQVWPAVAGTLGIGIYAKDAHN